MLQRAFLFWSGWPLGGGDARLLWPLGAGAAMMTGCGVTLALRICAAAFRWSLPKA